MQKEWKEFLPALKRAAFGSVLMLPMTYDPAVLKQDWIRRELEPAPLETVDLNENVRSMMEQDDSATVGCGYIGERAAVQKLLLGGTALESARRFLVQESKGAPLYEFSFLSLDLYLFHTRVAILCVGVQYERVEALHAICNPGHASGQAAFFAEDLLGHRTAFSLDGCIRAFCEKAGLAPFFPTARSLFPDAYVYSLAVVPQRFPSMKLIERLTFALHLMEHPDHPVEDESERDLRYVYAAKNQPLNSYGWGCCVTSQTLSYILADESLDVGKNLRIQASNEMLLVILALYEKYTCLHFAKLLAQNDLKQVKRMQELKQMMLEFQAFGTLEAANTSRWHNVKRMYAYLLEVCEIPEAIADIDHKVQVLSEHQQELETRRSEALAGVITLFGAVSILDSVLAIAQTIRTGGAFEQAVAGITGLVVGIAAVVVMVRSYSKS